MLTGAWSNYSKWKDKYSWKNLFGNHKNKSDSKDE